jgi:hypothetical protein
MAMLARAPYDPSYAKHTLHYLFIIVGWIYLALIFVVLVVLLALDLLLDGPTARFWRNRQH